MPFGAVFGSLGLMRIYNLFPLLAGKFADWRPHLERAKAMGFDWVFVNPIQRTGKSGSLYSIADYFEINPTFVDTTSTKSPQKQAQEIIAYAHELDLKIMMDLVINHAAADGVLVKTHPEWFVKEGGQIAHPFCIEDGRRVVWEDLAQIDHQRALGDATLLNYLLSVIEFMSELGCDGFRCDAAYQIPVKLWQRLIHETHKKRPQQMFVAETLGCTADQTRETSTGGFHYVFNSSKWWDFRASWLLEQYNLTREIVPSIGFPESHDTERLFAEMHCNEAAVKQRVLFTFLFASGAMMPIGCEFGFTKRMNVVSTTPDDWEEPRLDLREFVGKLNALKRDYQILREECPMQRIDCDNREVLMLWKGSTRSREEALILLNTDVHNRQSVWFDTLRRFVQSGQALMCVSPENPMEHIAEPFHYELRPGEAIVLVTKR
ncbi:MAG TPA: alpha-amylase family glycosyl hydrolase [Polyangiaceae bacterium]|nr:alpha-amylase family glycosyl hydrolase [Polyangiaceae bacterium]